MSANIGDRDLGQLANSSENEQFDVLAFQTSPVADAVSERQSRYPQSTGEQGITPAGQGYYVDQQGRVHGRASYAPSGMIPDGNGGAVLYTPPRTSPQAEQYFGQAPPQYNGGRPDPLYGTDRPWVGSNTGTAGAPGRPGSVRHPAELLDDRRARAIERSLHTTFNPDPYYAASALGGVLGSSVLPYYMDRWFPKADSYWRQNHSPLEMEIQTEQAQRQRQMERIYGRGFTPGAGGAMTYGDNSMKAELRVILDERREAKRELPRAQQAVTDALATARTEWSAYEADPTTRNDRWAEAQREKMRVFENAINDPKTLRNEPMGLYSNPADMSTRAYLNRDERTMLSHLADTDQLIEARSQTARIKVGEIHNIRTELGRIDQRIEGLRTNPEVTWDVLRGYRFTDGDHVGGRQMQDNHRANGSLTERLTTQWAGDNLAHRAGQGLAVGIAGLGLDALLDRTLNGRDQLSAGKIAQGMDGPLVAASLLIPKQGRFQIAGAAASLLGTRAIDGWLGPTNDTTYSQFFKQNWVEGLGMGAAWMAPFRSPQARLTAVVGAWAFGHALNYLPGGENLGIGTTDVGARMWDNVGNRLGDFQNSPSVSSFNGLVESATRLGLENEAALAARIVTFDRDNQASRAPQKYETLAALNIAMGNQWLEYGAKLEETNSNSHNRDGRMMGGLNYDMGGRAATMFHAAREHARTAENSYQQSASSATNDIERTREEQRIANDRLAVIYGSHDMQQIFSEVSRNLIQVNAITQFRAQMVQRANNPEVNDPQFRAKMYRDVALLDLAWANFKFERNESGGGRDMYANGVRYLEMAARLDPNSADTQQLQRIQQQIGERIGAATNNQWRNPFNNAFGIQQPRN